MVVWITEKKGKRRLTLQQFFPLQNLFKFEDWHSNIQNILVFCNNHLKIRFLPNFHMLFLLYHLSRTFKF